jgi:hypothetical protein
MVDYIAVFSDTGEGREDVRIDFLLESGDHEDEQAPEASGDADRE